MPSYERRNDTKLRPLVWERDKGICQICFLHIEMLANDLFPRFPPSMQRACALILRPWAKNAHRLEDLFEADHIIPVSQGGGGKGLDGLRLLCRGCHKDVTKVQAGQRARLPRKKYKNLK